MHFIQTGIFTDSYIFSKLFCFTTINVGHDAPYQLVLLCGRKFYVLTPKI